MSLNIREIKELNRDKLEKAILIFNKAVVKVMPYDETKSYNDVELEIYDVLTSRFIRVYEMAVLYLRAYDAFQSNIPGESFRDVLHRASKYDLIKDEEIWLNMREIRNKISHDYLPKQLKKIYDSITINFTVEIDYLFKKIK